MMLFAASGPAGEGILYECTPGAHVARRLDQEWLAGTNHFSRCFETQSIPDPGGNSLARLARLQSLVEKIESGEALQHALKRILADAQVEQRGETYGTVYANITCLTKKELWFTFGGYPAASKGHWAQLEWPW